MNPGRALRRKQHFTNAGKRNLWCVNAFDVEEYKDGAGTEFVAKGSIVRKIWGQGDTVLFIFAGAAAEFALNNAVDWLYFTGKLPADPLGRLFSTMGFARRIVFSSTPEAHEAIDTISRIHTSVEQARGTAIPDWAYRDVLFMLIHYSIASFELFERKLSKAEKEEVYDVFYRVGARMGLKELPADYTGWLAARKAHLAADVATSAYTADLFRQYKKHLGALRYWVLVEGQKLVVPRRVKQLLRLDGFSCLRPVLPLYKLSKRLSLDRMLKTLLLPAAYRTRILTLDVAGNAD